jgi:hypothetical protein
MVAEPCPPSMLKQERFSHSEARRLRVLAVGAQTRRLNGSDVQRKNAEDFAFVRCPARSRKRARLSLFATQLRPCNACGRLPSAASHTRIFLALSMTPKALQCRRLGVRVCAPQDDLVFETTR